MEQKKYFITVTNDANWMCKKKRQIKVGTADPVFLLLSCDKFCKFAINFLSTKNHPHFNGHITQNLTRDVDGSKHQ